MEFPALIRDIQFTRQADILDAAAEVAD